MGDSMSEFARDIYQLCIDNGQTAESAKRSALSLEKTVTEALAEEATEENTFPRKRRHLEHKEPSEDDLAWTTLNSALHTRGSIDWPDSPRMAHHSSCAPSKSTTAPETTTRPAPTSGKTPMSTEIVRAPQITALSQRVKDEEGYGDTVLYLMNVIEPATEDGHSVVIGGFFNTIIIENDDVPGVNVLMNITRPTTIESAMRRSRGAWLVVWPEPEDAPQEKE